MSKVLSEPRVPVQPDMDSYSVAELALFRSFTRDSYRTAFGVEPAAYDPGRPIKTWFDSTADTSQDSNVALYRVLGHDSRGFPALRQMVISAGEAATVNLPGAVAYPAYVVVPSKATRTGVFLNPLYLSLEADARMVMREVGGQNLKDQGIDDVFPTFYPMDEARRVWVFDFKGSAVNAGLDLYDRSARGVGSPGQWDLSGAIPVWAPAQAGPTGLDDHRPPREAPVRELLANERLESGLMQEVQVIRTDRQPVVQAESSGFTTEDRMVLQKILGAVKRLGG